ncbi:MAG TPA: bifunctional pyr operon transcriptional regulator/uracil phosphoribosyltransferase, partial [Acidimicrobiales bacterium]|nr:bifunctional pyr operon transcriptional regulator/uracil phosphoribosyltransferase [Acidimicrobiales bacterium]
MAKRERALAPPYGGVFVARTTVMDAEDVRRATWRMAHEIIERNPVTIEVVLVGLQTGGVWIAQRLGQVIGEVTSQDVALGTLDVAFYRDDIGLRPVLPEATTEIPVDLTGKTVILV